jgi:hypothetical protein
MLEKGSAGPAALIPDLDRLRCFETRIAAILRPASASMLQVRNKIIV